MKKINGVEVGPEAFAAAKAAHEVTLVSWQKRLEKLVPEDLLARYNRLHIRVYRCQPYAFDILYLTVRRHGSSIQEKNFYATPLFTDGLAVDATAEYDLLSFDAFNKPFDSITVEICSFSDFTARQVVITEKNFSLWRQRSIKLE
jgi:hypothetical protein